MTEHPKRSQNADAKMNMGQMNWSRLSFVLIGLLLLVGLSWYVLFYHSADEISEAAVRDNSEIYLYEIAGQKENQIQTNLHSHVQHLNITAEILTDSHIADEAALRDFVGRMKEINEFNFMGFLDSKGIVHTDTQSFPGISRLNFITRDLNEQIIEFNNTVSSDNLVMFVVPLNGYQYDGAELIALIAGVDTEQISDRMALFDFDTNARCEVILKNGQYVMQAPYDHLGSGSNFISAMKHRAVYDEGYSHKALVDAVEQGTQVFTSYQVDGARFFTYLIPVEDTDWYMTATISYDAVGSGVEVVQNTLTRNSVIQLLLLFAIFIGIFALYIYMRRRQDEVVLARIKAEENSRAKTDFLSQMSHDIRTPMNAIVGFTNLAIKEKNIEVIKENYLSKINTSSQHLLMLINDVLEMSRIESGKMALDEVPVDLGEILDEIASIIGMRAHEEGLTLHAEGNMTDRYVYCDKLRLNQILMNLLGNALKFTPEGGSIKVVVEQEPADKAGWAVYELRVSDTGIGMSPEFARKVFEPFERERTSTVSGKEGTGLGLSIVKSIVDTMNGTITVDSVKGEGTTFTVRMKLRLVEPELAAQMKTAEAKSAREELSAEELQKRFAGKRILLVEDNELNRYIAEAILKEAGFVVEQAEDGSIAVEMVSRVPADYYYVVLMDVQMPIMDGYEATRAIRAMEGERAGIKILAVTANAFASDVKDAEEAGMNGHIAKPIDVAALYAALTEVADK